MAKKAITTYRDKMLQANKEAKATLVALLVLVIVWLVCGIGLAESNLEIFSTPLWIIGGTLGTWVAAIVAAIVLVKCVFVDIDLDDPLESGNEVYDEPVSDELPQDVQTGEEEVQRG